MSRIPMGKVLLRNVMRHTDAHNKIQEESEMWKIREKEKQTYKMRFLQQQRKNRMRCDGYDDEEEEQKVNAAAQTAFTTAQDERDSRYWTRKLYEFEASDPNRWGHSGYKELYPEEFESESDQKDSEDHTANGAETTHTKPLKSTSRKRKRSSKSSKKKRKKKSRKKVRQKKSLQSINSSSDSESSAEEGSDQRKRIKAKKKHRQKATRRQKEVPLSSCESSSSHSHISDTSSKDDSDSKAWLDKRKKRRRKKRRRKFPEVKADEESINSKKKRKNWKIAHNDTSDESGDDELN
ncbi:uncharacterized protein NKAPD1 isoform X2 [Narcine bancroftii]|uniref:uncharacterized protein NKAPD1 isoform X2 n=1 Tax=Narcine bancroftii TaxID=1343680 RepID=UPI0038323025